MAHNLDPFGEATEAAARRALEQVQLPASMLEQSVIKGGANFSAGERQALALARALLHTRKLIVMDEPTANIDMETDAALQATLRAIFRGRTLLCIAHRLQTVIEMDSVVVMGAGRVLEHDRPAVLLADPASQLSGIVDAAGPEASSALRNRAAAAAVTMVAAAAASATLVAPVVEPVPAQP